MIMFIAFISLLWYNQPTILFTIFFTSLSILSIFYLLCVSRIDEKKFLFCESKFGQKKSNRIMVLFIERRNHRKLPSLCFFFVFIFLALPKITNVSIDYGLRMKFNDEQQFFQIHNLFKWKQTVGNANGFEFAICQIIHLIIFFSSLTLSNYIINFISSPSSPAGVD